MAIANDTDEIKELENTYNENHPFYARLRDEAKFILEKKLKEEKIKLHGIEDRIKSFGSFAEKVRRKESKKPFEEIEDIVGLRIICLFRSDIERIEEILRQSFEVIKYEDKINQNPDYFGYMSTHFIVKLPKICSGARYDELKHQVFEIQVRTLAMHSWASISHYLDYKSEADVPLHLKKSLNALSGLFYVADTQFENIYFERQKSLGHLNKANEKDLNQEEVNFDTISAYLKKRFPDREVPAASEISRLVMQLKLAGYTNIGKVDKAVSSGISGAIKAEKETFSRTPFYTSCGAVRVSVAKFDSNFDAIRRKYSKYSNKFTNDK